MYILKGQTSTCTVSFEFRIYCVNIIYSRINVSTTLVHTERTLIFVIFPLTSTVNRLGQCRVIDLCQSGSILIFYW